MAAALAGCLLAAGCGQSNKTTTHNPSTGGSVTTPSTTTAGSGAGAGATPSNYNPSGRPGLTSRAQYDTTSELPASTGPAKSTATVSVLRLDSGTEAGLVSAVDTYEVLPKTCTAQTVPGAVWVATVKATGVSFAVAGFRPAPHCYDTEIGGQTLPPNEISPFANVPPPPAGLFERQPGGKWVMNVETGKPFPCPRTQPRAQPRVTAPPSTPKTYWTRGTSLTTHPPASPPSHDGRREHVRARPGCRWALEVRPEVLTADGRSTWLAQLDDVALASDGYVLFRDNIDQAAVARSPVSRTSRGGSIRNDEVEPAAVGHRIQMVNTGIRPFHH